MATSPVESTGRLPAESLLGGTEALLEEPHSPLEWVELIRRGIPSGVVDALAASTRLTQAELAAALGIPARTLVRRKREGTLSSEESAKLVRLARVVERATEVFEDLDASLDWLKTENAALSGVTPLTWWTPTSAQRPSWTRSGASSTVSSASSCSRSGGW